MTFVWGTQLSKSPSEVSCRRAGGHAAGVPVRRSHLRAAEASRGLPGDPGASRQPQSGLSQISGE